MATEVMSDEEVLGYTQDLRRRLTDSLCAGGEVPKGADEQKMLLQTLADMDKAAISKMRLVKEDKNADADRKTSMAIAMIYQRLGNGNPFQAGTTLEGRTVEVPEQLLENVEISDGEMTQGIISQTYEEFAEKHDL